MTTTQVYSHRSLQPTPGRPSMTTIVHANHTRLQESLDVIRQEVDTKTTELEKLRAQRDDYESKVNAQVNELTLLRRTLYELENQHVKLRQQYEEEVNRLQSEMSRVRRPASSSKGSSITLVPNTSSINGSSDSRDSGRDRIQLERERGAPPLGRMIDPERELERLTDHRNAKRPKPQPDLVENSPIMPLGSLPKHPISNALGSSSSMTSPKLSIPHGESTMDTRIGQLPDLRNDGTWSVAYNPKVPRLLDITLLHTLTHGSVVCCVQFLRTASTWQPVPIAQTRIYDIKSGQQKCCLIDDSAGATAGDLYIRSVRFSPDGKFLATGAEDRKIRLWDISNRRICETFDGHQQEIYSLDFSRDGKLIASGSGDRTARIWELGRKSVKVFTITDATTASGNGHTGEQAPPDAGVTSVAISHDSRFIAAGSLDTIVRVWDIASGQLLIRLQGHTDSVYSVAFSADGRGLISGSLDKTLKYWDISGVIQKLQRKRSSSVSSSSKSEGPERPILVPSAMNFVGHKDYVLTVAVSTDGHWVVSGSKDRGVHFWDARNGIQHLSLQGHKNSVISLDLHPATGLLVTGSGDCQARIWSYAYKPC